MVLVKDSSSVFQLFSLYEPQFLEVHLVFEVSPVWEIYIYVCSLSIVAVTAATIYLVNELIVSFFG